MEDLMKKIPSRRDSNQNRLPGWIKYDTIKMFSEYGDEFIRMENWEYTDWHRKYTKCIYWLIDNQIDSHFLQRMVDKHFAFILSDRKSRDKYWVKSIITDFMIQDFTRIFSETLDMQKDIKKKREIIKILREQIDDLESNWTLFIEWDVS